MDSRERILEKARHTLEVESRAISDRSAKLSAPFVDLAERLLKLDGHIAITGVGKSGLVGEKISATLSSTGTPSFFLKPVEALHGDLGMLSRRDALLAISNSGETHEVLAVVQAAKNIGVEIFAFTGVEDSSLGRAASITVDIGVEKEACPLELAPTASTTVTLAIGDALAMVLLEERGFTRENYAQFHPGGSLGQRLKYLVRDVARSGDCVPIVRESASVERALAEMTERENLGITLVTDEKEQLVGVLTDGDLRRLLVQAHPNFLQRPVSEVMGRSPKSIQPEASAADALQRMESQGITALAVVDLQNRPVGLIHLHDILGRGQVVL